MKDPKIIQDLKSFAGKQIAADRYPNDHHSSQSRSFFSRLMDESTNKNGISVKFFTWADWHHLWRIRFAQLAEAGIVPDLENIPGKPENVLVEDATGFRKPGYLKMDANRNKYLGKRILQ